MARRSAADLLPDLSEAGYREQVFCKAYLLMVGAFDRWPSALHTFTYDARRDELVFFAPGRSRTIEGDGDALGRIRVRWEGTQSLTFLRAHGHDDSDVPAKTPPPDASPASIIEAAPLPKAEAQYLLDLLACWLHSPEGSKEEELLYLAHDLACERLGVDPEKHASENEERWTATLAPETPE